MVSERAAPVYRVRINHVHTLAAGWRLAETTVECTFAGDENNVAIQDEISRWLADTHELGFDEAARRNHKDAEMARLRG